jgi:1-acyl-sn-glycerol-3-phosphate acyltransferase
MAFTHDANLPVAQAADLMLPLRIQSLVDPWRASLPALRSPAERFLLRVVCAIALGQVRCLGGAFQLLPAQDPFILVANHSSRREAIYLPALLMLLRGGRPLHWLADWNFRLLPGVGWLYDRSGAITVARKPARPRFLTPLRGRWRRGRSALAEAQGRLLAGASVALFPEGKVNRDASALLPGLRGAARLSLEARVPVVPVGIRFAGATPLGIIDSASPLDIQVGAALSPPEGAVTTSAVAGWHAELMRALAPLSGKSWPYG